MRSWYKEWTVGHNGKPPVKDLEEEFGSKWRTFNRANNVRFYRYRAITRRIEAAAGEHNVSEDEAAELVQKEFESSELTFAQFIDQSINEYKKKASKKDDEEV